MYDLVVDADQIRGRAAIDELRCRPRTVTAEYRCTNFIQLSRRDAGLHFALHCAQRFRDDSPNTLDAVEVSL